MKSLIQTPGVFHVKGDMCCWGLRATDDKGREGLVRKATGWLTNNERLATLLSRRCTGDHQHVSLLGGGRASRAQQYTLELRRGILGVLRDELVDAGELNSITGAGPVPEEEIEYWLRDAAWRAARLRE